MVSNIQQRRRVLSHFDAMTVPSAVSIRSENLGAMGQVTGTFETEVADGDSSDTSKKRQSGNWKACALIFGCEACERLGFYAISSNLVGYLTTMLGEDTSVAVRNANNWSGTVRFTPLIGAIIADSYLGRFVTIGIFMCVYLVAQIAVTASVTLRSLKPHECKKMAASCTPATGMQVAFFYSALYALALGAGGVKACVFPFAADQFDATHPVEARSRLSCANWWFVAITSGTVVAVSFLVYAQAALGWAWGYGIPTAVTAACTLVYFLGAPLYRHQDAILVSPLTRVAQVLVCAARNWRVTVPADAALLHEIPATQHTTGKLRSHTPSFTFLDRAAVLDQTGEIGKHPDPWKVSTVSQVEEVKTLARLLPIWLTNITFWVVYAQVTTLFLNQGTTLNRQIGNFQIPAASMPLFLHLAICAFLPIYDALLVPLARRFTGNPRGFTILQRIGVGQAISIIPIAIAAVVENRRLHIARTRTTPLPMSILWLLPQYTLFGVAEVFLSVGQIEFFTDQAPESMRSLGNAMAFCAIALGSFGSSLLVGVLTRATQDANGGWIGNDVNRSHIDYFFWLLTVISVGNLAVYVAVARRYKSEIDESVDVVMIQSGSVKRVHPMNVVDADF